MYVLARLPVSVVLDLEIVYAQFLILQVFSINVYVCQCGLSFKCYAANNYCQEVLSCFLTFLTG